MTGKSLSGLPDYLAPGLRILFVGINPGLRSARIGHHFAGPSNRFWKLLRDSRLLPGPVTFREDKRLLEWGIGLTNLVARPTSGMHDLRMKDFLAGRRALLRKVHLYRPRILALLGLSIGRVLLSPAKEDISGISPSSRGIKPGLQLHHLAGVPVFVLPNPSGRNAHYSYQEMLRLFGELGRYVDAIPES